MVTRCGRCNHELKTFDSIKLGYGPACAKKIKSEGHQFTLMEMIGLKKKMWQGQVTDDSSNLRSSACH
jgi:hypothetical protein